jgi:RsiW-degrading membrane proteinase PrsW (M82 family)
VSAVSKADGTAVIRPPGRRMVLLRRWSWLPVLVVGAVLYELVRLTLTDTGDPLFVPTLILLGAAVIPVAFVAFISGRDLSFGVGGGVVGLTALLGGVVGVLVAGSLEYATARSAGSLSPFAIGLIEEFAKLLVPTAVLLVYLLSRRNRHPADGLLLGVACGAGFAVLETMGYALVALVESSGNLSLVNGLLLDRGLLSPAAHMAWTGLATAALWRAATEHWRLRTVVHFVVVYLLVSALHAGWDSTGSGWAHAGLAVVSLGLLVWTAYRLATTDSRRHDRRGAGEPRAIGSLPVGQPGPGQSATTPVFPRAAARSRWQPASISGPRER